MTSFADAVTLSRFERGEDRAGGSSYTIKRQGQPFVPMLRQGPACACCYAPLKDARAAYCSREHREAHQRLRGAG